MVCVLLLALAGCRGQEAMEPGEVSTGAGQICFVDADGTPLANTEVSMRTVYGALGGGLTNTDTAGCVSLAGVDEGLYQPVVDKQTGKGFVYLAAGDRVNAKLLAAGLAFEYADSAGISAQLTELAGVMAHDSPARDKAVERALAAPKGSKLRMAGLLATFWFNPNAPTGQDLEWTNHSQADANELLDDLSADSPLLTIFTTAPMAAVWTIGESTDEHPLIQAIEAQHPDVGVQSQMLATKLGIADREGDAEQARMLHDRASAERYRNTPGYIMAVTSYAQYAGGPAPGERAPALDVVGEDGERRPLIAKDRPTLVYLDAGYCGPCRPGPKHLRELADRFGERLHIVSVSIDEDPADAVAFREKHGPFPGLVVDAAKNPGLAEALGASAIPHAMMFAEGRTVARIGNEWPQVEAAVTEMMGE
jgi:thiol-disulfide isomerase/thioredoxin